MSTCIQTLFPIENKGIQHYVHDINVELRKEGKVKLTACWFLAANNLSQ